MTREHVFPQWLRGLFPGLGSVEFIRRLRTREEDIEHSFPGAALSVVVKEVCRRCNNDWLSPMETDTKDIITPLVLGQARTLNASEQYTVAVWATKTILTVQGANIDAQRALSPSSYEWFYKHRAPLPDVFSAVGATAAVAQRPLCSA